MQRALSLSSWCDAHRATDHGEIVKLIQLLCCGADCGIMPQITGNREGDTASAMWSRSWQYATDHGEIVKVIQPARCGADCGGVPHRS